MLEKQNEMFGNASTLSRRVRVIVFCVFSVVHLSVLAEDVNKNTDVDSAANKDFLYLESLSKETDIVGYMKDLYTGKLTKCRHEAFDNFYATTSNGLCDNEYHPIKSTVSSIEREYKYCRYSYGTSVYDSFRHKEVLPYDCNDYFKIFQKYGSLTPHEMEVTNYVQTKILAFLNKKISDIETQKDTMYDYQDKINQNKNTMQLLNNQKEEVENKLRRFHFMNRIDKYYSQECSLDVKDIKSSESLIFNKGICINNYKPYRDKILDIKSIFCAKPFNSNIAEEYLSNNQDVAAFYAQKVYIVQSTNMLDGKSSADIESQVNKMTCDDFSQEVKLLIKGEIYANHKYSSNIPANSGRNKGSTQKKELTIRV